MTPAVAPGSGGGRPTGGPLFFATGRAAGRRPRVRRLAAPCGALVLLLAGCGGGGGPGRPSPGGAGSLAHPLEVYRELGLVTGPQSFPAVASFATLAGPADSTYVIFGLSLPANALRFQRESAGFRAEYTVSVDFRQDTLSLGRIQRGETVRVATFAETERTEESIVFQGLVTLPPGEFLVDIEVRDAQGSRGFRAEDTLAVPAYGPSGQRLGGPLLVYRVSGRSDLDSLPDLILNPRYSVEYGAHAPRLYFELYGANPETRVGIRLHDGEGNEVWAAQRNVDLGSDSLRYLILDIPSAHLALGRMQLEVVPEDPSLPPARAPLLVTVSDQWVAANFDEVLQFIGYIASSEEMDTLRTTEGPERQAAWERFWERRDPLPATPINEFREAFFERVRVATQQFREPGAPGWRTDRGEVYIVLGPPTSVQELSSEQRDRAVRAGNAIQWIYDSLPGGRLALVFVDQSGFGRYELTPSSRSAYQSAAERLRPRR